MAIRNSVTNELSLLIDAILRKENPEFRDFEELVETIESSGLYERTPDTIESTRTLGRVVLTRKKSQEDHTIYSIRENLDDTSDGGTPNGGWLLAMMKNPFVLLDSRRVSKLYYTRKDIDRRYDICTLNGHIVGDVVSYTGDDIRSPKDQSLE